MVTQHPVRARALVSNRQRWFEPCFDTALSHIGIHEDIDMKTSLLTAGLISTLVLLQPMLAQAEGYAAGRFARGNAAGGVSGGSGAVMRGPSGAGYRGHAYATDGQGNGVGGSSAAIRTPYGAAARGGVTTHSADGTTTHQSAAAGAGARGRFQSSGTSSYNPATGLAASRSTTATANSGASYSGQTSYSKGTGVSHTSTCKDPSGYEVPCR